jgi:phosphoribosylglycinamide formyltransferase-1
VIGQVLDLGFLASRNGASAKAIVGAIDAGELSAEARLLISNNRAAPALAFAAEHGIARRWIATQADPEAADVQLCAALETADVELVVLSGYLRKLGPRTLTRFRNRVLNIHPGPLPGFGGQGMYGRRVHEAVLASGAAETAICIHLVDGDYDQGPVIARQSVAVTPDDTVDSLEARVRAREPAFFVETLQRIARGALALPS